MNPIQETHTALPPHPLFPLMPLASPLEIPELLSSIFSHLSLPDIASAACVQRSWKHIATRAFQNKKAQEVHDRIDEIKEYLQRTNKKQYTPEILKIEALHSQCQETPEELVKPFAPSPTLQNIQNDLYSPLILDAPLHEYSLIQRKVTYSKNPSVFRSTVGFRLRLPIPLKELPKLSKREELDQNLEQALQISDNREKCKKINQISHQWLLRGNYEKAIEIGLIAYQESQNLYFRVDRLKKIFEKQASLQGAEAAFASLGTIQHLCIPQDVQTLQTAILLKASFLSPSELEQACTHALHLPPSNQSAVLFNLIMKSIEQGYVHQSLKFFTQYNPQFTSGELNRIADAFCDHRQYETAYNITRQVHAPFYSESFFEREKIHCLLRVMESGCMEDLSTMLEFFKKPYIATEKTPNVYQMVLEYILSVRDLDIENPGLHQFCMSAAGQGEYEIAKKVLPKLANPDEVDEVRTRIGITMVKRKEFQKAIETVLQIRDEENKNWALSDLVHTAVENQNHEMALQMLPMITNPYSKNLAIRWIIQGCCKNREYDKAKAFLVQVSDPELIKTVNDEMIESMINNKSYQEALASARTPEERGNIEILIIRNMSYEGHYEAAIDKAQSLPPSLRRNALTFIIQEMNWNEDYDLANGLSEQIEPIPEENIFGTISEAIEFGSDTQRSTALQQIMKYMPVLPPLERSL